ncbi:DUF1289 domain-containing protein [Maribrevibacterium harenarium]|uniref:DUF1289 domain-containing protein n=2 Tax=Maribrevibacterium harenarium TaxID=2589817 RepID=A0A501WSH8_9GAMM|nr:DUF1289 domain-containing protein [Maribrevibacterium harenarium]
MRMNDVPRSPCVNVCFLNDEDICVGCYRTGQEISHWGRMSDAQKRDTLVKVAQREKASRFVSSVNE